MTGVYFAVYIVLLGIGVSGQDYCSLSCYGQRNTMCKFPNAWQGPKCQNTLKYTFTQAMQTEVLNWHNDYRNKYAVKAVPGQTLPGAANMRMLSWDDELAKIAKRWISQCIWGHDECRKTNTFSYVGQNIGEQSSSAPQVSAYEVSLKGWVAEMKDTPQDVISQFRLTSRPMIGHFTQVVWAETTKVGCAQVDYKRGSTYVSYFACNYGPGGNIFGRPVYQVGTKCTACPKGTSCRNSKYRNLCS